MFEVQTIFHVDGDLIHIERKQDVGVILDVNKAQANSYLSDTFSKKTHGHSAMQHVARIPNIVVEQWMKDGFNIWGKDKADITKELAKRLNDPDNEFLKTIPGRI